MQKETEITNHHRKGKKVQVSVGGVIKKGVINRVTQNEHCIRFYITLDNETKNKMGVTTTAEERIQKAKDLIDEAQKELLLVLDKDTWGHRDYKEEYIEELEKIVLELLKMKRRI